jgi:plastocyanin
MRYNTLRFFSLAAAVNLLLVLFPLAAARAADTTVSITTTLAPKAATVQVGDTVSWVNDDSERHRIRSISGPEEFDSGNLDPGESFTFNFAFEGTYSYIDDRDEDDTAYHGTITVSSEPVDPPGGTTLPPPSQGDVEIIDDAYRPATFTIAEGGTVRWVNRDRDHPLTARARSWDSGIFDVGGTYQRTFPVAGTYAYFCILHPDMLGTIVVTGDGGQPPPTTAPPPTTVPPPPPPPPSGTDVTIIDNAFTPRSISVAVGTTLSWANVGIAPHTVTSSSGGFDSGFLFTGDTYQRTFNAAGAFDYICTIHPEMTGTVTVSGDGGGVPPPPRPPTTTVPPPPPPSGSGDVQIVDNAFTPRSYSVAVGSTVRWVNAGALPHTVTSNAGGFDSGFVMAGQTYQRTFNAAGTYDYICTLHPEMTGTITVGAGGTPPPVTPQDPEGPPGASGTQGAGPADVSILDNAYEPAILEAATGQTITWQNDGVLPHTVTATDSSFDSSFMVPGAVYQLSFGAPGEYAYFCTVHPEMTGVVVVTGEATGDGPVVPVSTTSDDASSPTPLSESETSSSNEVGAVRNVRLEDNFFSPADITVDVGDTVIWRNGGQLPHTATDRGGEFDSGFVEPGKEFEVTFDSVGQYEYFCTIHPEMVGTITVQERRAPVAAGIAPSTTGASSLSIAIALSMSIVVAMGLFTLGMARFARMADAERGTVRPAG